MSLGLGKDHGALLVALEAAVPLHIIKIRDWAPWVRREYAQGAVDSVACYGDTLLYGGKRGEAAEVFNHVARGLAVLACQPGGVTFSGVHWCGFSHPFCPHAGTRPPCCACGEGCQVSGPCGNDCAWCRNGCKAASGRMCCAEEEEVRKPRRPETVPISGGVL